MLEMIIFNFYKIISYSQYYLQIMYKGKILYACSIPSLQSAVSLGVYKFTDVCALILRRPFPVASGKKSLKTLSAVFFNSPAQCELRGVGWW